MFGTLEGRQRYKQPHKQLLRRRCGASILQRERDCLKYLYFLGALKSAGGRLLLRVEYIWYLKKNHPRKNLNAPGRKFRNWRDSQSRTSRQGCKNLQPCRDLLMNLLLA